MSLVFGPPIVTPGLVVSCPEKSAYWYEGASAVVTAERLIVYDGLNIGVVTELQEGGRGTASIVVEEDGTPGVQVEMVTEGVWDVILADYFGDALCPGVDRSDPLGSENAFFGHGDGGSIALLGNSNTEQGAVIQAFLRPNVIAPAGIGRSHLYQNVYLATEGSTGGLLRITPVIDGEVLTDEEIIFAIPSDGITRGIKRYEIPLSRPYDLAAVEQTRAGIVGTWFTVEIEVLDVFGCGRLTIAGIEVEYSVFTQSIIGQTFTGESQTAPLSTRGDPWFFAGTGPNLNRGDSGTDDAGTDIAFLALTNEVAPAGIGGECIFEEVFVALTRFNANTWNLTITPIVDGVELESQTITLAGVANPVTEIINLGLSQPYLVDGVEESRTFPRGAWIALKYTSTDAPDREVTFEEPEVAFEVLTESLEAVD